MMIMEANEEPEISLEQVFDATKSSSNIDSSLGGSWGFASVERGLDLNLSLDLEKQEGRMRRVLDRMNIPVVIVQQDGRDSDSKQQRDDTHLRQLPQQRAQFQRTVDSLQDDLALALEDVGVIRIEFQKWRSQAQQEQTQQLQRCRIQKKRTAAKETTAADDLSVASSVVSEEGSTKKTRTKKKKKMVEQDEEDSDDSSSEAPKKSKKKKEKKQKKQLMEDVSELSVTSSASKRKSKKTKKAMQDNSELSEATEASEATSRRRRSHASSEEEDDVSFQEMDSFVTATEMPEMWDVVKKPRPRKSSIIGDYEICVEDLGISQDSHKKRFSVKLKKLGESASSIASDATDASGKKKKKKEVGNGSTTAKSDTKKGTNPVRDDTDTTEAITDEDSDGKAAPMESGRMKRHTVSFFDWSHFSNLRSHTEVQNRPDFFDWNCWLEDGDPQESQDDLKKTTVVHKTQSPQQDGNSRKIKKRTSQ